MIDLDVRASLTVDAAFLLGYHDLAFGERHFKFGVDLAAFGCIGVPQFGLEFFDGAVEFVRHCRLLDVCERRRPRSSRDGGVKERGTRPAEPASGGAEFLVRPQDRA
ncbi:hypothetical protein QA644_21720 (plasmid) [Rhizobium sp. CC1099]|uniref:hypothetical protein n=1 Tax=Rhizobium sp. CC1099 TaxID=3039160 RepID=UPI0024B20B1E|nr:hypothetical protein [Rhizobium sp. CC1099]WFU90887.1 hypothetical protein QA644_21720 [Rhizobium sp. CC1099]